VLGRVGVTLGAMVGDPPQPGFLQPSLARLADGLAATLVLVVGREVADAGVQMHALVADINR
jgi:hypothetical protein